LTKIAPFFRLLFIAVSCYIILIFCQILGTCVFRLSEGKAITAEFIHSVLDTSGDLPPKSWGLLTSLPSIFEEVAFRGVLLTFFLLRYSKRKSIVFSSFGFAIIHIFNLLSGRDPIWVAGQVIWAFILGLFYGYLFIKTGSLLPVMIVHYLGNLFIYSFAGYIQETASVAIQALYGVTFTLGLIPVAIMILWTRFFSAKWPFENEFRVGPLPQKLIPSS
jgi:membrane protease YdiL (CAAX protease family)